MLVKFEIFRDKIEKNLHKIKSINKNIICVLKDDAYGMGIENVLPVLLENGIYYFAVAYIEEALIIRDISEKIIGKENAEKLKIMTLSYIEAENLKKAAENNIEITVFSLSQLDSYLERMAEIGGGEKNRIHLKVNTGMNRLGFDRNEIPELIEKLGTANKKGIAYEIVSVYSHISNAENSEKTKVQIERYEKILKKLNDGGVKYRYRHIQASPALFKYGPEYNYDFARVGMAIYGMEPLRENAGLNQTVKLSSRIISIRKVAAGEQISYGNDYILKEEKTVAIIPAGYAHGLKKQIENSGAYVLAGGRKAFILGEVCMDMIIADITEIENVRAGDEAVIIGRQGDEEITLQKMAEWAGTIQDDILCSWNRSIKRTVI